MVQLTCRAISSISLWSEHLLLCKSVFIHFQLIYILNLCKYISPLGDLQQTKSIVVLCEEHFCRELISFKILCTLYYMSASQKTVLYTVNRTD